MYSAEGYTFHNSALDLIFPLAHGEKSSVRIKNKTFSVQITKVVGPRDQALVQIQNSVPMTQKFG